MATEAVKLPEIQLKGIYEGKYRDRAPGLRTAGKLTYQGGESTAQCMKTQGERPTTPDVIRRFNAFLDPQHGKSRVHYGRANDPQRQWVANMTHGLASQPSLTAGDVVNPFPKTLYQFKMHEKKDAKYLSKRRGPLGSAPHPHVTGQLPKSLDPETTTFGVPIVKDDFAGELINPNKTNPEVEAEGEEGRELYRRTHADYIPGEQHSRHYTSAGYDRSNMFGIPTPHDNGGTHVKRTMKWLSDSRAEKAAPVVTKRVDAFRERTQPQLGKVHDPIKDTLNVPDDHTFGIMVKPDEYGVGDLLHGRVPSAYLRGKDRLRGIVAALRQQLKKENYQNFDNLLQAFAHYDKNKEGRITLKDLREVCVQYNLPAEPELIEQLLTCCDVNSDGFIDYLEFSNFLNWRDKMPSGVVTEDFKNATPPELQSQIDKAVGDHRTSASMINATVGGISTQGYRKYGIPTVRSDLAAPKIKRVSDRVNYGDESDAYGLVNPSIFSNKGVYEKDFLLPRPRDQLFHLFTNIGVQMTLDTFDNLYSIAAQRHPKGHVSIESFRSVMDDVQTTSAELAATAS